MIKAMQQEIHSLKIIFENMRIYSLTPLLCKIRIWVKHSKDKSKDGAGAFLQILALLPVSSNVFCSHFCIEGWIIGKKQGITPISSYIVISITNNLEYNKKLLARMRCKIWPVCSLLHDRLAAGPYGRFRAHLSHETWRGRENAKTREIRWRKTQTWVQSNFMLASKDNYMKKK